MEKKSEGEHLSLRCKRDKGELGGWIGIKSVNQINQSNQLKLSFVKMYGVRVLVWF